MITIDTFQSSDTSFPAIDLASRAVVAQTFRGNVYAQQGLFFTPEAKRKIKEISEKISTNEVLANLLMRAENDLNSKQ